MSLPYLPVPQQSDCSSAWLAAVRAVDGQQGHAASNVIIAVANPTLGATMSDPIVRHVDEFLQIHGKSVSCVANTIFPQALYTRYGYPGVIDSFHARILPKVRKNKAWSGYYFERMTAMPAANGDNIDQLRRLIDRLNDPNNKSCNKHEVAIFDPSRDVTGSPYGGQCLSFLSFHVQSTPHGRRLDLTAQYRNHYYIEKLLGNLIGLGRLMAFVAAESGLDIGALTVVSTHAEIDQKLGSRAQILALLDTCDSLRPPKIAA